MARKVAIVYYDSKPILTVIGMYGESQADILNRVKSAIVIAVSDK